MRGSKVLNRHTVLPVGGGQTTITSFGGCSTSDCASDYDLGFRQAQREGHRLSERSLSCRRDLLRPPGTETGMHGVQG